MKNLLKKSVLFLIYPLLRCRQTLLEASEVCGSVDFVGYADFANFKSCDRPRESLRVLGEDDSGRKRREARVFYPQCVSTRHCS